MRSAVHGRNDLEQKRGAEKGRKMDAPPPPGFNDVEQKRRPAARGQSAREKDTTQELRAGKFSVQSARAQGRGFRSRRHAPTKNKNEDRNPVFGAQEMPLEGMSFDPSTTPPSSPPEGRVLSSSQPPFQLEETKEEQDRMIASLPALLMGDEEGHNAILPGAERVGGNQQYSGAIATVDDDTIMIGGYVDDDDDSMPARRSSANVTATAHLVEDPVTVVAVSENRREESDEEGVKHLRRQMWIGTGIGLLLVVVIASILSFLLVERERGTREDAAPPDPTNSEPTSNQTTAAPSLNPTTAAPSLKPTTAAPSLNPTTATPSLNPTTAPTSVQQAWKSLIQSRLPSTTFGDSTSPQQQALDWMLQDSYTLRLNDDNRIIQRFALAVLYYSTIGLEESLWLTPSTECGWGSYFEPPHARCTNTVVDLLDLDYNNHSIPCCSGSIPREIGLLSSLTYLDLATRNWEGSIPSELGLLTSVPELDLYLNNLEGFVPSEIGLMTSLTVLNLAYNFFLTGTVPSELANLNKLEELYFDETNLSGSIPSNLCDTLTNVRVDCIVKDIQCDCCEGFDPETLGWVPCPS